MKAKSKILTKRRNFLLLALFFAAIPISLLVLPSCSKEINFTSNSIPRFYHATATNPSELFEQYRYIAKGLALYLKVDIMHLEIMLTELPLVILSLTH